VGSLIVLRLNFCLTVRFASKVRPHEALQNNIRIVRIAVGRLCGARSAQPGTPSVGRAIAASSVFGRTKIHGCIRLTPFLGRRKPAPCIQCSDRPRPTQAPRIGCGWTCWSQLAPVNGHAGPRGDRPLPRPQVVCGPSVIALHFPLHSASFSLFLPSLRHDIVYPSSFPPPLHIQRILP